MAAFERLDAAEVGEVPEFDGAVDAAAHQRVRFDAHEAVDGVIVGVLDGFQAARFGEVPDADVSSGAGC